ncbi:hypothetical protein HMPREF9074_08739 [Capnocytophaga sp. oral taxon 329 str. F0087]|nr:hypothetical protein HMPREF9074_08739 [Capnocytophaga sp. oral taxon 329 str. F0087]
MRQLFLYYLADFPSLIVRSLFAHRSSHTRLRQLADFCSLIVRLSFAHRSVKVRAN